MCFLVDDDDTSYGGSSGNPKVQLQRHHTWLIPRRALMILLVLALVFCIFGMILLAIGGGTGSAGAYITGGIMFTFGIIGLIVCLFVCLYAYCYYGTRDQAIQTEITWLDDYTTDGPGYASVGRPSALKSADSTLKRNGTAGQKKVTMAPEVGPYGESPPNAIQPQNVDFRARPQIVRSPSLGSGTVYFPESSDPRGAGGRIVGGTDVGTGGIRITTIDRNQPFPSPGSQASYGVGHSYAGSGVGQSYASSGTGQFPYGAGQTHTVYSGGGSSASSVDATYAYPKSLSTISGHDTGFSESASGSQYSTLRTIPVTHIVSDPQRQRHDSFEYARINKQAKADVQPQRGYLIQGHIQSPGQFERQFPVSDDFDYDNPVERTPMIPQKQLQNATYHEKQMQYQRQQSHDLYTPRQLDIQTLQREAAANPYHNHHQQQQQYQSSSSSSRKVSADDLPDLQPLVYPSARRPMTFEQVSSSKVSVYDNMLANLKDGDE